MTATYEEFLRAKVDFDRSFGHPVDPGRVNAMLKPHQRDIVVWAVAGGRRAVAERRNREADRTRSPLALSPSALPLLAPAATPAPRCPRNAIP